MRTSPIAFCAAGFLAGGIILGGAVAHARITSVNGGIAGVPPGNGGSLFCVTAANRIRAIVGVSRIVQVNDGSGAASTGVELRCPG